MKVTYLFFIFILFACSIMIYVDGVLQLPYAFKSIIKLLLFFGIPISYYVLTKTNPFTQFKANRNALQRSLLLGLSLYFIIVGGYLFLQSVIDFSNITNQLEKTVGVNATNFIFVALYISIINSFLEEFFFRVFAFNLFKTKFNRLIGYVVSSALFSLYHVAMMIGWFHPMLFFSALLGLFFVGLFFNWLNERYQSIYPSWFVHLFANLGINTVGLMLFDLI